MAAGRAADDGAVRAVWHQSRHRVPAGRALSERRTRRADAALAGAAPAWSGDGQRDRRGDRGAAAPAALLGTEEAPRGAAAWRSEAAVAGAVDHRRSAAPRGVERTAAPAADRGAGDPAVSPGCGAERSLVHRF